MTKRKRRRPAHATPPPTEAARAAARRVGRPPRTTGGGNTSEGQLAVRFSRKERAELDQFAKNARTSAGEVVRIALRNMGVISWTEPSAA